MAEFHTGSGTAGTASAVTQWQTSGVKTSRAEELLFGQYAPALRSIGRAVEQAEKAMEAVSDLLNESRNADDATSEVHRDENGDTEHTRWLETVFNRAHEAFETSRILHEQAAAEFMAQWAKFRAGTGPGQTSDAPE